MHYAKLASLALCVAARGVSLLARTGYSKMVSTPDNRFQYHTLRRDVDCLSVIGHNKLMQGNRLIQAYDYPISVVGHQETMTRDNNWKSVRKAAKDKRTNAHSRKIFEDADVGGDFVSVKSWLEHHNSYWEIDAPWFGDLHYQFKGWFDPSGGALSVLPPNSSRWPDRTLQTVDDLFAKGGTAVKRASPVQPASNAAAFIGELREGLPSLVGKSMRDAGKRVHKGAGGEYLNYQFGYLPMISDLKKFAQATSDGHKIWNQYLRDAGKRVRRGYRFPQFKTETVEVKSGQICSPSLPSPMYTGSGYYGDLTITTSETRDYWFSGAFTYHALFDKTLMDRLNEDYRRAQLLYGVRFDPDAIWQLAPWSWTADWFANTGDVISNMTQQALDGLVMDYGYIMCQTERRVTYSHSGMWFTGAPRPTGPITWTVVTRIKQRTKAHPFGFGFTDADLSPRQWAILTALGLSRGR